MRIALDTPGHQNGIREGRVCPRNTFAIQKSRARSSTGAIHSAGCQGANGGGGASRSNSYRQTVQQARFCSLNDIV
jgi:hypothetical protein